MVTKVRSLLSMVVIAAGSLISAASDASASLLFSWSGDCFLGCSGSSTATIEVRDSYVGGTNLVYDDFVSFSYTSSSGTFSVPGDANLAWISGTLPAVGTSGASSLFLDFTGWLTHQYTSATGFWRTAFVRTGVNELGTGSNWSSAGGGPIDLPAPGSFIVLLGALLVAFAISWIGRRRRQYAQPA